MSIVRFGVQNPVPVSLLTAAMLIGGLVLGTQLRREFFPETTPEQAIVTMPYPGASPEEVEETLAIKVEDALAELDEVEEIRTSVSEGGGLITVEFHSGVNPDKARDEVERAIDALQDLPEESEQIQVQLLEPRMPVIRVALYGELDERVMKEAIRGVRDDLRGLPGMGEIVIEGTRPYEISIEVRREAMLRHGISLPQISDAVGRWLEDVPGGTVRTNTGNIKVRTLGVAERAQAIREVVVAADAQGRTVRVQDIATVREGFADEQILNRHNGLPAATLTIFGVGDQDIVSIAKMVRAYVAARNGEPFHPEFRERLFGFFNPTYASPRQRAWELGAYHARPLPTGAKLETVSDLARFVEGRLSLLLRDAIQGTALVFLVLLVFLNFRAAFWVGVGLIVAIGGAIVIMYLLGVTLNLLSMFGLIVVVGLMVDDAIVVTENTQTLYDKGLPAGEAGIRGTEMVLWPVVTTVVVEVLAFLPLAWVKGQIGDLIGVLPLVVAVALGMSLLESLLILPSHLSHGLQKRDREKAHGLTGGLFGGRLRHLEQRRDAFVYGRLLPGYGNVLRFLLRNRYAAIAGAVALIVFSLGMVASGRLVFTFLPDSDAETIIVEAQMPIGTPIDRTDDLIATIEAAARAQPETRSVTSQIGQSTNIESGQAAASATHVGQMFIELKPVELRERDSAAVIDSIRAAIAGKVDEADRVSFVPLSGGPVGADISIRVRGNDLAELESVSAQLKQMLAGFEGVYDIADDNDLGQAELRINLKPAAAGLGFTVSNVARQVRGALYGLEAHTYAAEQEDIDVRVRLDEETRSSLADVENLWLISPQGDMVPLSEIAEIVDSETYASIRRIDRQRAVTVTAETVTGLSPEIITQRITAPAPASPENPDGLSMIDRIRRAHPNTTITFTGRQEQIADAFGSLPLGFAAGLLMIYFVLAWLFSSYSQPIIVLLAVPFSIVGVVWGHLALGYELTFLSLIGFVALAGVVTNDSLILVEFFNHERDRGLSIFDAIVAAGQARLRAIGLTTITAVLGLTPLMLEQSFQARFLIPMAISLSMGLLSSAVLVLFVLPCCMLVGQDLRRAVHFLWHGETETLEDMGKGHAISESTPLGARRPGLSEGRGKPENQEGDERTSKQSDEGSGEEDETGGGEE